MDKSSIMKHLENDSINPFSRENLTLEELNKYNQSPEIISKILEFSQKRDAWLSNNNMTL